MPNIIVKSYEHVNRALPNWDTPNGRYIKNKDEYDRAVKESGMISFEESRRRNENKKLKDYNLSSKGIEIIKAAKNSKDKNGNVRLTDRTIDAMKDIGAIGKKIPSYMNVPKGVDKGGFYKV